MFGLGATELIVILVLALVLLGPSKLPQAAAGLGKAIRQFRKATRDLGDQLDIDDEVKQPFRELRAAMRDEPAPYVPPAAPANTVAAAAPASAPSEPPKPPADPALEAKPEGKPEAVNAATTPPPKVG
jgi:sec-independent protein translocase protein TatB